MRQKTKESREKWPTIWHWVTRGDGPNTHPQAKLVNSIRAASVKQLKLPLPSSFEPWRHSMNCPDEDTLCEAANEVQKWLAKMRSETQRQTNCRQAGTEPNRVWDIYNQARPERERPPELPGRPRVARVRLDRQFGKQSSQSVTNIYICRQECRLNKQMSHITRPRRPGRLPDDFEVVPGVGKPLLLLWLACKSARRRHV